MNHSQSPDLVEELVNSIKEKFNMAFNMALNQEYSMDSAEACFREPYEALFKFKCNDLAADQKVNFAKIWFFRGEHGRALAHMKQAVDVYTDGEAKEKAAFLFREMCGQILERGIRQKNTEALDMVATYYAPDDYRNSMELVAAAVGKCKDPAKRNSLKQLVAALSLEVLRQGISCLKEGRMEDGQLLLTTALPYLNPKRAEMVKKQLDVLER